MKKLFPFIVGLLLMAASAWAKPVDVATVRRVADTYMRAMGMRNTASLVDVTAQTPFTEFYIFAAEEGGFILVSGDDCVKPILGYSLISRFEVKDMPEHVFDWLQGYEEEIRKWKEECGRGVPPCTPVVSVEWARLEAGEEPEPQWETSVSPLLTTTWGQSPRYNNLCPYDSTSESRTKAGCVATATAQMMKYWNHPATGYGSNTYTSTQTSDGVTYTYPNLTANFGNTTYQWATMPNAVTSVSTFGEVNAVATLIYHVGVAVAMRYTPSSSSANTYDMRNAIATTAQNALMKYFKYRPDMALIAYADYSDSAYSALLRAELDQERPALYSGRHTSGGHSFVLDGYDMEGNFHFNFGWRGSYDGYYALGAINPYGGGDGSNSSGTYNMKNVAVIGIQPNTDWDTAGSTTVNVVSAGNGTTVGSGSYAYGDTVTMEAVADVGYRFKSWNDGSKVNPREFIATGGNYTFTATFDSVAGDTLHYCPGNFCINAYRNTSGATTWGIMLPASLMSDEHPLTAVQLYVRYAGTYNLTVYSGASHTTVAATASATFDEADKDAWQTIVLGAPVDASDDLWIVFTSSDGYPASFTYGSGVAGSFLWTSDLAQLGLQWGVTAMVKGIFSDSVVVMPPHITVEGPLQGGANADIAFSATATSGAAITWSFPGATPDTAAGGDVTARWSTEGIHQAIATATNAAGSASDTVEVLVVDYAVGDTVSYCLDRPRLRHAGYDTTWWGIMIPERYLVERDTLKEVLLYIEKGGDYTLNVYSGGSDIPGTLVFSQTYTFDSTQAYDYVHCVPNSVVMIDKSKSLWIVFVSSVPYPAAACEYVGEPNSNWISNDGNVWQQMHTWGDYYEMTWMIKAVTAKTVAHEGIEEFGERSSELRVYPNPASTTVTLSVGTQRAASAADITILDQQGRVVLTQAIRQSGDQAITFDVSTLPAGLYYVKVGTRSASFIISR